MREGRRRMGRGKIRSEEEERRKGTEEERKRRKRRGEERNGKGEKGMIE